MTARSPWLVLAVVSTALFLIVIDMTVLYTALLSLFLLGAELDVTGYEIHHGRITVDGGTDFLGGTRVGSVFGTMWHGALEGDAVRRAWLREVAAAVGREIRTGEVSFPAAREARIEALADLVDEHLDMDALLAMLSDERTLPVLRGTLR